MLRRAGDVPVQDVVLVTIWNKNVGRMGACVPVSVSRVLCKRAGVNQNPHPGIKPGCRIGSTYSLGRGPETNKPYNGNCVSSGLNY